MCDTGLPGEDHRWLEPPRGPGRRRYRVVDLYGCWPTGEERPAEPTGYQDLTWAEAPKPVVDLEAELRSRLAQAPASPPARAARQIGWLFSEWMPDRSLDGGEIRDT